MIPIQHRIGGRMAVETSPNDPAATLFIADAGNGRIIRQPASLKPLLDRVASGEPFMLDDNERGFLRGMQIELLDATEEVRERDARKAYASGVPANIINAGTTAPHYRAALPIKFLTALKPAS